MSLSTVLSTPNYISVPRGTVERPWHKEVVYLALYSLARCCPPFGVPRCKGMDALAAAPNKQSIQSNNLCDLEVRSLRVRAKPLRDEAASSFPEGAGSRPSRPDRHGGHLVVFHQETCALGASGPRLVHQADRGSTRSFTR